MAPRSRSTGRRRSEASGPFFGAVARDVPARALEQPLARQSVLHVCLLGGYDVDLVSRHRQADADAVKLALAVMTVRCGDPYIAPHDVPAETRQMLDPLANSGLDRLGSRRVEKVNLQRVH